MSSLVLKPDMRDRLLAWVGTGRTLTEFWNSEGMPPSAHSALYAALREDEIFRRRYEVARDCGFDAIADRLRATARGYGRADGGDSTADWQRDKLIVETDLKLLAKWCPKRYGERAETGIDGADGDTASLAVRAGALLGRALEALQTRRAGKPDTPSEEGDKELW